MSVPSLKYVIFLFFACGMYYTVHRRFQTLLLLIISWSFYGICQPYFFFLLVIGSIVCYGSTIAYEEKYLNLKKTWIVLGTLYFLCVLIYYKYDGFFFGSRLKFLSSGAERQFPIGISFYTFTALAYLFEIAKGNISAEKSFTNCALYISFFPTVLSGPINRPGVLLPQIQEPRSFSFELIKRGLMRVLIGAIKKLVVANNLACLVDAVYLNPGSANREVILLAVVTYSLQIYFDFSGYSDIALGTATIFGFSLPENFHAPYLANTIRQFWRRWHVSLTSWFRDYLYIPLGGSHVKQSRMYLNILIVFAVSGLWHGADWSFVLWGLLNGFFQVAEMIITSIGRRTNTKHFSATQNNILRAVRTGITFFVVSLCWVFFRADNVNQAIEVLSFAFGIKFCYPNDVGLRAFAELRPLVLSYFCVVVLFFGEIFKEKYKRGLLSAVLEKSMLYWPLLAVLTVFLAVFGVYGGGYSAGAFIYFQF